MQQISHSTSTFDVADGERLFMRTWQGPSSQDQALLIVHGMGEHSGRYETIAQDLAPYFGEVVACDLRGHGCSTGLRGDAPSVDQFCEDVLAIAQMMKNKYKSLTILGHSMGGLITLRLLQTHRQNPFDRAIVSAPFLGLAMAVPLWKRVLGRVLVRTAPRLQLTSDLNPSYLSHDPAIVAAYVKDRLVHAKMTPRLYFSLMETLNVVCQEQSALPCPSLFLVPGSDSIVNSAVTLGFVERLKDRQKTLKQYPGFFHEPLNEKGREQVLHDIGDWLTSAKKGGTIS